MTDHTTGGESSLSQPLEDSQKKWQFRLYVFGSNQNSLHALGNIYHLCRMYLNGDYAIDVVDLHQDPLRAFDDKILVTPTLVRLSPEPQVTIIGTLDNKYELLSALGINPGA